MFQITQLFLLFTAVVLLIQPCLSQTAQEISIPGYNQNTSSSVLPFGENTTPQLKPKPKPKKPVPATEEELQQLITSVDLSGWSKFSVYLWTCTTSSYSIPTYNSKEQIQASFDLFKTKKKMLTLKMATKIANEIAAPTEHQIVGLYGDACHIKIAVNNVKIPYNLDCYSTVLDARYFSQFAKAVADNNDKDDLLSKDIDEGINNFFTKNCKKK